MNKEKKKNKDEKWAKKLLKCKLSFYAGPKAEPVPFNEHLTFRTVFPIFDLDNKNESKPNSSVLQKRDEKKKLLMPKQEQG